MQLPRRVLFLTRVLDSGGVTTHLMTLARGLRARGCEVALASAGAVGAHAHGSAWFEAEGVRTFTVPFLAPSLRGANLAGGLRAFARFDRACAQFRPDLMHVHFRATSPYAEVEHLRRGIPFVSTLHLEGVPAGALYRAGSFWGARAIAISTETREHLQQHFHVPPERLRLVPNGVDACHFHPPSAHERAAARARFGLAPHAPVLSMLGRFEPIKNHALLLRALARLRGAGVGFTALLAGEGRLREALQADARAAGLAEHVRFVGYCDAREVLWASDVTVLTSVAEGCGLSTVEGMLCGVVPVRTPTGGARDQVRDGVEGFIVPFDDAVLAERLHRLLTEPALRARMGAAALRRARARFTDARMVEDTLRVYAEALEAGGRAGRWSHATARVRAEAAASGPGTQ